jgi:hypothetical protein
MRKTITLSLLTIILCSFSQGIYNDIYLICKTGDFLFTHCKTEIRISAPGIPPGDLSYISDGCRIFPGNEPGTIYVYPESYKMVYNKPVVKINVLVKNQIVQTREFQSIVPPLPAIELYSDTKKINLMVGEAAGSINKIQIHIQPDPAFSAMFPEEDDYTLSDADLILVRGKRPVYTGKPGNNIDVSEWPDQPGDRFMLRVKELTRITSAGEKVPVTFDGIYNICMY